MNMWNELKERWLRPMTRYKEYEKAVRGYFVTGDVTLKELYTLENRLVKEGANLDVLIKIQRKVLLG